MNDEVLLGHGQSVHDLLLGEVSPVAFHADTLAAQQLQGVLGQESDTDFLQNAQGILVDQLHNLSVADGLLLFSRHDVFLLK